LPEEFQIDNFYTSFILLVISKLCFAGPGSQKFMNYSG